MASTRTNPFDAFRWPATQLARATIWAQGGYGILQGLLILFTGDQRFSAPSFAIIRSVPGGPDTWGVFALGLGTLVLVASHTRNFTLKAVGLLGLAAWDMCFVVGITVVAAENPLGSTTGIPTYFLLAVSAAILVWVDESRRYRL